jgi:hypothetical protein
MGFLTHISYDMYPILTFWVHIREILCSFSAGSLVIAMTEIFFFAIVEEV